MAALLPQPQCFDTFVSQGNQALSYQFEGLKVYQVAPTAI